MNWEMQLTQGIGTGRWQLFCVIIGVKRKNAISIDKYRTFSSFNHRTNLLMPSIMMKSRNELVSLRCFFSSFFFSFPVLNRAFERQCPYWLSRQWLQSGFRYGSDGSKLNGMRWHKLWPTISSEAKCASQGVLQVNWLFPTIISNSFCAKKSNWKHKYFSRRHIS